jgi:phosphoglycerate dehydrogenase-like enzyme
VNRLLILSADAEKYAALIAAAGLDQLHIMTASDPGSAESLTPQCNIILGDPRLVSEVLASAQLLKWVQSSWAGVDHLCRPGLRRDYVLTGVKDIFGPRISEYVMMYLLSFERQIFTMRNNQLKRFWHPLPYRPLDEITMGIIGLGSIGRHLASMACHFGIRVIGMNQAGRPCVDVEKVFTAKDPAGFFEEADYIVLTLPDTPKTRHFINAEVLKLMKTSAVLLNVGRGSLINEADLVDALQNKIIGGAVLDVFSTEPLPPDSPLWQQPDIYLTPHNAAVTFPEDIVGVFADNYQRFLGKKPLRHVIDFDRGY